jgi:hypothetical protein
MISFDIANAKGANAINWANRLAARRQTQAQRDAVFAKYQSLVGTMYRNSYQARMEALRELSDPQRTPEYWDEDTQPRLPLGLTSSMLAKIQPVMGGAFVYFQSDPSKPYFYPGGGTESTAKRIEELVTSPDIGQAFHNKKGI